MPSCPRNYPFYNWVPKPIGIIILLFFFLPILSVGGVYSVNSTEMMSGLGIISEHIQFANFVTSIGMAAFAPFLYELVCIRREKLMCIAGFALMYVFSYVCAKTDSIFLLALCSLLTGFLRMVLMMVNLFTLIKYAFGMEATRNITPGMEPKDATGWNKLDIEKCISQPVVYLFFMILGQMGTALTAWLAFEYEWKYVYYFMMGILLLSILILFITMPNHGFAGRFPINFRKFGITLVVMASMSLCLFGAMVGLWIADFTIGLTSVLGFITLLGMIVRNVILMYQHAEDKRKVCHWSGCLAAYDAGKRRMVPIFLTTATTAVGVVPMMLGGSTFWAPVGITIFAGGIGSLILVVTILPVLYSKIYK